METFESKFTQQAHERWHIKAHITKMQTPTCGAGKEDDGQGRQSDDLESLHGAELTMSCASNTL